MALLLLGGNSTIGALEKHMKLLRHNLAGVLLLALFATYCGGRTDNANGSESGITGSGEAATPPVVNSITPANNATGANRDVAIQITFSVVVNTASVTMTANNNCTGSIQVSTDVNFGAGTCNSDEPECNPVGYPD